MTTEARGGEPSIDNPIRTWVRSTLEKTQILPEHRLSLRLLSTPPNPAEGYIGMFVRPVILPPITTPQMREVNEALSHRSNLIGGKAVRDYFGDKPPSISEMSEEVSGPA